MCRFSVVNKSKRSSTRKNKANPKRAHLEWICPKCGKHYSSRSNAKNTHWSAPRECLSINLLKELKPTKKGNSLFFSDNL